MDPVATDPPPDPDFPATTPALTVHSGGEELLGVLHVGGNFSLGHVLVGAYAGIR